MFLLVTVFVLLCSCQSLQEETCAKRLRKRIRRTLPKQQVGLNICIYMINVCIGSIFAYIWSMFAYDRYLHTYDQCLHMIDICIYMINVCIWSIFAYIWSMFAYDRYLHMLVKTFVSLYSVHVRSKLNKKLLASSCKTQTWREPFRFFPISDPPNTHGFAEATEIKERIVFTGGDLHEPELQHSYP